MGLRIECARIIHEPLLVLLTLALVTVARLVLAYVALPLAGAKLAPGWRSVIALSGMRRALSVALVIGLPAGVAYRFSIECCGASMRRRQDAYNHAISSVSSGRSRCFSSRGVP